MRQLAVCANVYGNDNTDLHVLANYISKRFQCFYSLACGLRLYILAEGSFQSESLFHVENRHSVAPQKASPILVKLLDFRVSSAHSTEADHLLIFPFAAFIKIALEYCHKWLSCGHNIEKSVALTFGTHRRYAPFCEAFRRSPDPSRE